MRTHAELAAALALALAAPALAQSDGKTVVTYEVLAKKKAVGTSKAVIERTASGMLVVVTLGVKAEILGKDVSFSSMNVARLDGSGRATSFSARHERMGEAVEIEGRRSSGGFEITRTGKDGSETFAVADGDYDHVSVEPALYSGPVGTVKKVRILYTQSGQVKKATVSILGREKRLFLGKERTVTHFRIKGAAATLEDWRTDDGISIESLVKTTMGTLHVKPVAP